MKQTALVMLETVSGDFIMQLRDDIPTIKSPNQWGLFGGHVEAGESALEGAVREIYEELDIQLTPSKLSKVFVDETTDSGYRRHVFHCKVSAESIQQATIKEGQRFAPLTVENIASGNHQGHIITPHHMAYITNFASKAHA